MWNQYSRVTIQVSEVKCDISSDKYRKHVLGWNNPIDGGLNLNAISYREPKWHEISGFFLLILQMNSPKQVNFTTEISNFLTESYRQAVTYVYTVHTDSSQKKDFYSQENRRPTMSNHNKMFILQNSCIHL